MEEFEDEEDMHVGEEELEIDLSEVEGKEEGRGEGGVEIGMHAMGSTRFNGKIATCYAVDL